MVRSLASALPPLRPRPRCLRPGTGRRPTPGRAALSRRWRPNCGLAPGRFPFVGWSEGRRRPRHRRRRCLDLDPHRGGLAQQGRQGLQPQLRCGPAYGSDRPAAPRAPARGGRRMTCLPDGGGLRPAATRTRIFLPTGPQAIATGCRQPLRESLGIAKVGRFRPACAGHFLHTSYTGGMDPSFPPRNQMAGKVRSFRRDERFLGSIELPPPIRRPPHHAGLPGARAFGGRSSRRSSWASHP